MTVTKEEAIAVWLSMRKTLMKIRGTFPQTDISRKAIEILHDAREEWDNYIEALP